MQAVVPAHKLFTFTKGLIARAVDGGVRFAYFFPEDGFFIGHIFFANRNRPAVGLTLEAGTLGRGQATHNVLSV